MSSQTKLEIAGNLSEHPLAELLIETTEAQLSGSFHITQNEQKIVVYLSRGKVVFAASNSRQHRLFEILQKEKKTIGQQLVGIKNIVNDLDLRENLLALQIMAKPELDAVFSKQIEEIIKVGLSWETGNWEFSSLVRIKDSIHFPVDLNKLLLDFSHSLKPDKILQRFASGHESVGIKPSLPVHLNLQSHEAFVLSRFENSFLDLSEIDALSGLPESITRQVIYSLWLGGFLFRRNWDSALSESNIVRMQSAQIHLKRDEESKTEETGGAFTFGQTETLTETAPEEKEEIAPEPEVNEGQLLAEYLIRIENASTLYEIIGVSSDAETSEIKQHYFAQAKKYHPDLFYKKADVHTRIQNAFTDLAHAYEILKTEKSRELYDYKMRKELTEMKSYQVGISEKEVNLNRQAAQAVENFEWGLNLLMEGESEQSVPFFARAVHFANDNARYHAYYGKALSADKEKQHKAEGELQTAIRMEPENITYRIMLAELFIHIGLFKRAEGELKRLLTTAPNEREALTLLDSLQKK